MKTFMKKKRIIIHHRHQYYYDSFEHLLKVKDGMDLKEEFYLIGNINLVNLLS
jgi:hypothetical protein